ncbi:UDP-2,3-diacylglucosamine diphosphatase [Thioflexithrix psekupsensis]|uniref:UDP-2,3-diacylglucosamine hydrolase n=1 Tax=Thioflexithrix psekupsensis TaxID=1570016 RepID=A0A251XA35_9GAMM|nr:UDP-2,3-diacylglucosamine diphosphatase [Thioflexithrix psekupsensis]OUD14654.1 UDP-2,3-diacylglucosamine diphosphatase [Thioflexithrix psekupsensis]
MPETLFIADLHLSPEHPSLQDLFIRFLQQRACQAESLYILGDLFETWLGDDDDVESLQPLMDTLLLLTQRGLHLTVMRGNRDFLLTPAMVQRLGGQLYTTDHVIADIYGRPTLLLHGDTLCTEDIAYQTFRRQVRSPEWQTQFLSLPLTQRRDMARQARHLSQHYTQQQDTLITDVTLSAVCELMQQRHVNSLIHGHTHRPAIHEFMLGETKAYRYVVGNWHDDAAVFLSCRPEQWTLETWLA